MAVDVLVGRHEILPECTVREGGVRLLLCAARLWRCHPFEATQREQKDHVHRTSYMSSA